MGLTKQYLRYVPGPIFNVIASLKSNAVFVELRAQVGRYVAAGACENVIIWDSKTGEKINTLLGEKHCVTVLKTSPNNRQIAVGYEDGVVRLFDLHSGECLVTFSGHKSAVTCLSFDTDGMRLVSGAKDTNIIVWDTVSEAGLFRLSGHKGPITKCCFLESQNILVSSSIDTLVKFWDLDTHHCFKTLVGHRSEVWDMVVMKDDRYLVTGCSDSELRVWKIRFPNAEEEDEKQKATPKKARNDSDEEEKEDDDDDKDDEDDDNSILQCTKIGTILRQGRDRVLSMTTDASRSILACHGMDSIVELFRFHSEEEIQKIFSKRQRKFKKQNPDSKEEFTVALQDEVLRIKSIQASAKVKAIDIYVSSKEELKLLVLLRGNSFEIHVADTKISNKNEMTKVGALSIPGHRTDVRALSFSSDKIALASASGESLKIWNRGSQNCIRTMACDYALSILFATGDRNVIVATKTGKLQIFDIAAGRLLEEIPAHEKEAWSVAMSPDLRGIASGGADKKVKFWQFELVPDLAGEQMEEDGRGHGKRLSLAHTRTLQLEEDVLCVKFSPDHRLIAVSLLDSTVKIFFVDTLKFFLSLYGHKFPVLCMDISYDSSTIITGGADRNIKIWGLDFGDCHRSIFAHEDSILGLQFVSKTHLFFSCGKDGKLKQWDADNFENITTLSGHHGQVWTLAVSEDGKYVGTAGHDRSIRLWERTQEPLVLEDERETQREAEADQALALGEDRVIPGIKAGEEASLPGRKTVETERAAERIMEAVEVHKEVSQQLAEYRDKLDQHKQSGKHVSQTPVAPQTHPLMVAYDTTDPDRYLLKVLRQVKSSEVEEALLVLPFHYVCSLLTLLDQLLQKGWETELVMRILLFIVRVHHGPLSNTPSLLSILNRLQSVARKRVDEVRDRIGFNLAGLQYLQRELEEREAVQLFADASDRVKQKRKQRRNKDKAKQRAILTL